MKTFVKYLGYRLKKSSIRTLVFTVCTLAIVLIAISENLYIKRDMYGFGITYSHIGLEYIAIAISVFSTLIPMLETAEFKNRRNLDTLYFLPMSRVKLALAHYLSGFIQVAFIHTVTFWSAWIYWLCKINSSHYIRSLNILPIYWLLSLAVGFIMYSIFIFIFCQGNNVLDGFIFCVAWMFIFFVVVNAIIYSFKDLLRIENVYDDVCQWYQAWTIVYMPINNLTMIFQGLTEIRNDMFLEQVELIIYQMYMFFVWVGVAAACVFGYFWTFIRKGAEKAGEISDSWFGYRTLIPIYAFCVLFEIGTHASIDIIIFWMLTILAYVIYRRGFKFKLGDIIIIGIFSVLYLGNIIF